jgi:hypothetical protein
MTACVSHLRSPARATALLTLSLLALGLALSGCAGMSEGMTAGFADPAKYELYDCKQLETERKAITKRQMELQGLMAKAQSGTAGPLVAEMVYRDEWTALRGQAHFAEEAWRKNKCHETPPDAVTAAAPGTPPFKPVPSRPGSAAR